MRRLVDDLASLTCIEADDFNRLINLSEAILCHNVVESIKNKESFLTADIGIGTLSVTNENGTIRYKFIPSASLSSAIATTYDTKKSPLKTRIEKALGSRLKNTYKELL